VILVIAAVGWIASGFYIVEQGLAGIVLRFGEYVETTSSGLRWHLPYPIEERILVNIQQVNTVEVGYRTAGRNRQSQSVPREALMLTADENIIDLQLAVQYDVKDPRNLIFFVADDPQIVVRGATESALREVVGFRQLDFVLTEGRSEVVQETRALVQTILDRYQTGINIIAVEMQDAQPPREVKPAFDDAVKAREDQVRLTNEAEAYSNDIIPRARGRGARLVQQAQGYKASVIARSEGEVSRFLQVLTEYRVAPEITRDRLYLESMEQVLTNSSKLMIDQSGGNNVIYLPLDQLIRQRRAAEVTPPLAADSSMGNMDSEGSDMRARDTRNRADLRERRAQ
jgi:membrane protease subunit HflK